jgi:hypothetical protein
MFESKSKLERFKAGFVLSVLRVLDYLDLLRLSNDWELDAYTVQVQAERKLRGFVCMQRQC